jgi:hypothetical protein
MYRTVFKFIKNIHQQSWCAAVSRSRHTPRRLPWYRRGLTAIGGRPRRLGNLHSGWT